MKAEPRSVMNSRSPRVVGMARIPTRGVSGRWTASKVKMTRSSAMQAKKIATSDVQAIQAKLSCRVSHMSDPPQGKALGDVVPDEPDDERPGDDGEDAGS